MGHGRRRTAASNKPSCGSVPREQQKTFVPNLTPTLLKSSHSSKLRVLEPKHFSTSVPKAPSSDPRPSASKPLVPKSTSELKSYSFSKQALESEPVEPTGVPMVAERNRL
ncbi:hypothetical protein NDU88_006328 [Pleurodeles waltl]|uniref:Uncharacterized protein n=1 Tax=Pleurodeles waltl TaxID=8319 RepID=A0AAV7QKU3_PLEWA|nr:hypothetical protein NDU88_006328 [Pleurodeles waltl]